MSAITAKASRIMKKYAVLTREPRCFLGSFDFSWEQRKLGEIGSVSMCRRIFKEQTSETGDIPFYKIGTFGADPDAFISRELFEEYKSKYPYPQKGDILISASGSIGRTVEFAGNNEYFQDSNIVWLNHDERLSNPFLKCFYSVVKWAGIEGSTIKRLYNDNILNTVICMPSVPEQKRIGLFFENLDNLITLHQRKCANLCSPSQVVFSLLFATSTFSWEQRKLGDIGKARSGVGFPDADQGGVTGVPFFKVSDMNLDGNENEMIVANNYVTAEQIADHRWSPITELPAIFFAKVGAAVMLNRKRLCRFPFLLDNNTMAYSLSPTKWDADFAKALFGTVDLTSLVQVGALPSYNAGDVESMGIYLPSLFEQEQIGAFFKLLDNLITLHQRECISFTGRADRLILTANKKRTTSSWEQRKFGEVFDCTVPNNTLSRAELSYDEGTVLNVHYGDVLIKYDSVLDVQKDDIPRIPHRCREDFNGALLQDGDVIIADTAEDETTGKACEIGNLQGSAIVSGLHTMVCRPRNRMALGYLGYYLNSNAYHHQLLPLMQGIKVLSLSRSNIQKTSVSYPSAMKEQQLIASYFSQLDHLITLHQRKPFLMKWRTSDANRNQTNRLVL